MSSSGSDSEHIDDHRGPLPPSSASKKRRLWTKQEDEKLRLLVSYWGDQSGRQSNWDKIASQFVERTAKNCRKRWFHSLDPKLRRGKWSPNEDKVLLEAYEQLGPAWQRIAQLIPGRTDDQCSKRYTDVLDPAVQDRLRPWTDEEDEKLLLLHSQFGAKWQVIASEIKGRTGLVCRNRWRKLTKPPKPHAMPNSDINGTVSNSPTASLEKVEAEDVAGCMAFEVPGSTGFPAGADATWFQAAGVGPPMPTQNPVLPPVSGVQKQITVTVEDGQMPQHHAITGEQLERLLQFSMENSREIVVHQHIYQAPPASQPLFPPDFKQFPLPPPDEFLSRPLLYEEPPQPEIMAAPYEDVDFLAFNPS